MVTFLQQLINGISQGSAYALIALGYTMVYGVLRLINFAHSDVYMFGAFMGYYIANSRTFQEQVQSCKRYDIELMDCFSPGQDGSASI